MHAQPFGASFQILTLVPQRRFAPLLSVALMLEYEEVLKRDDMRAQSHLTVEEIDVLLDMFAAVGTPCTPFSSGAPNCPIPAMKWYWNRLSMAVPRPSSP